MIGSKSFNIIERKSSNFGQITLLDTQDTHTQIFDPGKFFNHGYYDDFSRFDLYKVCRSKYLYDQLARPIINLYVNAIFNTAPDFQGDKELVKAAEKIAVKNNIIWHQWGADLEVMGDMFIRIFDDSTPTIASIPAETMTIEYDPQNVLKIEGYIQYKDEPGGGVSINEEEIVHLKVNVPSNVVYGSSTLRPILWWLDVLDNLFERNWLRSAQYYGSPVVVITGVPAEHQSAVKSSIEGVGWRPGRTLVLPQETDAKELDFAKQFPIQEIVDRVYQYVLSACSVPQHLIYESDSSRGVAMFSGDSFEWMVRGRQQIWGAALYELFKRIFQRKGIWKADSEFKIGWTPTFQRDLKNLSDVVAVLRGDGTISKRTAREIFGIDHSTELERLKDEEKDDKKDIGVPGLQTPFQQPAKTADNAGLPDTY